MKILLLSCSTGEGHNHCALAVKEALDAAGHETSFLDMLHMFGDPGPLSFDKLLNRISSRTPEVFGMMYHAGEMYSSTGVTSPVYLANLRHARQLSAFVTENGYDAVVCSHLFPMETLTFLRRHESFPVRCYGILSDYTCIPFLPETELDGYFLPHDEVRKACVDVGLPAGRLFTTGMPVARKFSLPLSKTDARAMLGLPEDKKIYLIMTGGIGCGDAVSLCDSILRVPDESSLLCVLPGRNEELRAAIESGYQGRGVMAVPFTDKVAVYMRAADVLLSKAGGISSSEAAVLGVRSCTLWPSPASRLLTPSSSPRTACRTLRAAPTKPPALPTGSSMIPPPPRVCCTRRIPACRKTVRSASPVSSAAGVVKIFPLC